MKKFKSTLENAEKYFETSRSDMESFFQESINTEKSELTQRNTISLPLKSNKLSRNPSIQKRNRSTMSDRLNTVRPAPLVVLSNAGSIIQSEKYRNTFLEERVKESPVVEAVPPPPDHSFQSFDIFSPTGNSSRSPFPNSNVKNEKLLKYNDLDNSSPIERVVETKESNINTRKKKHSTLCILL